MAVYMSHSHLSVLLLLSRYILAETEVITEFEEERI